MAVKYAIIDYHGPSEEELDLGGIGIYETDEEALDGLSDHLEREGYDPNVISAILDSISEKHYWYVEPGRFIAIIPMTDFSSIPVHPKGKSSGSGRKR